MKSKSFLFAALAAVVLSLFLPHAFVEADAKKKGAKGYRIGLSMYSLRQLFRQGKLHALDYPKFAKETFGITDIDVWDGAFPKGKANDPEFYKELKKRADAVGSNIFLLMAGAVNANHNDAAKRMAEAKKFFPPVDRAVLLGAKYVRVFLRAPNGDQAKSIEMSALALKPIADYAKTKGVIIVIEPGASKWSQSGVYLAALAKKLNHPALRLVPDFGKMKNADPYGGTVAMMPYSLVVSAKSHNFDAEGYEKHLDYKRLMKSVQDAKFNGIVAIEYEGNKLGPVEGVKATQKLLQKLRRK
ncbi:MAG: TIM barrel protein [Planctomycetota bacterium]